MTGKMTDYCDYDTSRGYSPHNGLGCFKGIATHRVHILYERYGLDRETVGVCDECYKALKRDCRRQGYRIIREGKPYENSSKAHVSPDSQRAS